MLKDFISLIYPDICLACDDNLYKNEEVICTKCLFELPKTNFHNMKDNPIEKLFWGRVNIHAATAFLYFTKGEKVQKLLHHLKYNGQKQVGIFLGKIFGEDLKNDKKFSDIKYIVPIPLHRIKQSKRGYNQSEMIAIGLSQALNAQVDTTSVERIIANPTQTKQSKSNRWENVKSVFAIKDCEKFKNSHILIVDDVITTGSTIEACVNILENIEGIKISIAAIAVPYN